MRIGFDAKRLFSNFTGLGNYSRTLVQNIAEYFPQHELVLYSDKLRKTPRTEPFFANDMFEIKQPRVKPLWRYWRMSSQLPTDRIDIYHGLSAELPLGITVPSVVTIHDLIFERNPKQYNPIDVRIYRQKAKYACKHADKILAISEATKQDIIQYYSIPEQKIKVIYQTCDSQFFEQVTKQQVKEVKDRYKLPTDYLLYVGSIIERKNLLELVKAVELLGDQSPPLAVIGAVNGAYAKQVVQYVNSKQLNNKVLFLKDVAFQQFPALYKGAKIMVYPSYYEGFGIPVIESQAVGTPVITSNQSSLIEAGGPHSVLLDDLSANGIASGILQLLNSPQLQEELSQQGLEYVKRFEAKNVTEQLINLYEEVLQSK